VIGADGSIPSLRLAFQDEWATETGFVKVILSESRAIRTEPDHFLFADDSPNSLGSTKVGSALAQ